MYGNVFFLKKLTLCQRREASFRGDGQACSSADSPANGSLDGGLEDDGPLDASDDDGPLANGDCDGPRHSEDDHPEKTPGLTRVDVCTLVELGLAACKFLDDPTCLQTWCVSKLAQHISSDTALDIWELCGGLGSSASIQRLVRPLQNRSAAQESASTSPEASILNAELLYTAAVYLLNHLHEVSLQPGFLTRMSGTGAPLVLRTAQLKLFGKLFLVLRPNPT